MAIEVDLLVSHLGVNSHQRQAEGFGQGSSQVKTGEQALCHDRRRTDYGHTYYQE